MTWDDERKTVSELIGMTLTSVERIDGSDGEEIIFIAEDGRKFSMRHDQDCCESVYIESIVGDLADLVGSPITMAEEVSSDGAAALNEDDESYTWTFYKFATVKGYVDIRWYGSSNGYYGESADFYEVKK